MDVTLSVVIVEYNRIEETLECIASLKQHISVPFEIIISSNSCYSQRQKDDVAYRDENVHWLFNDFNGGFAYAMNEGLKVSKGKYLIIMNSDCLLTSDLVSMIDFMEAHPQIGAIAPQMRDADGNIQDTARPYVSLPRYLWRQARRVVGNKTIILNRNMDYHKIQTVDWLIGAFIMVSRKAYEATGGMDNNFFLYAEDLDWCTRIRQKGFEVVYFPDTTIIFKGTRRARSSKTYAKIFIQSHILYWKKFGFFYGYPKRENLTF